MTHLHVWRWLNVGKYSYIFVIYCCNYKFIQMALIIYFNMFVSFAKQTLVWVLLTCYIPNRCWSNCWLHRRMHCKLLRLDASVHVVYNVDHISAIHGMNHEVFCNETVTITYKPRPGYILLIYWNNARKHWQDSNKYCD